MSRETVPWTDRCGSRGLGTKHHSCPCPPRGSWYIPPSPGLLNFVWGRGGDKGSPRRQGLCPAFLSSFCSLLPDCVRNLAAKTTGPPFPCSLCFPAVRFEKKPLCFQGLQTKREALCSMVILRWWPLAGLSIPLNGQHQGGWHARAGDEPCVPPLRQYQDSLQGVRNEALLCSSQGQIFPIQAIMGGRPRARATRDTVWGRALHGGALGREKKKTGCKHKLYFLGERMCVSTCLFIYKPWEHWVPLLWDSGLPLALPFVHVPCSPAATVAPANCFVLSGAGELVFSHKWLWLLKTALPSGCIFLPPSHCPTPSLPSQSSPALFSDS